MTRRRWLAIGGGVLFLLLGIGLWFGGRLLVEGVLSWSIGLLAPGEMYPPAPPMPAVVEQSLEELLWELEHVLEARAPAVAASLRPGLTDEELAALEAEGGFRLPDELRTLYRWRDGMSADGPRDFLPGHRFVPLAEVVRERDLFRRQVEATTGLQKAMSDALVAHRLSWLAIFDDGSGDGYFYDVERNAQHGAFFCHITEMGYYRFFPSVRNFVAGVIECFEADVYRMVEGQEWLDEDFRQSRDIWQQFGAGVSLQ